ncbi:hypothetical protein DSECCO2_560240 [anaerobic digester metagenome]
MLARGQRKLPSGLPVRADSGPGCIRQTVARPDERVVHVAEDPGQRALQPHFPGLFQEPVAHLPDHDAGPADLVRVVRVAHGDVLEPSGKGHPAADPGRAPVGHGHGPHQPVGLRKRRPEGVFLGHAGKPLGFSVRLGVAQHALHDPGVFPLAVQKKGPVQGMIAETAQGRRIADIVQQGGTFEQGAAPGLKAEDGPQVAGEGRRVPHVRQARLVAFEKAVQGAYVKTRSWPGECLWHVISW